MSDPLPTTTMDFFGAQDEALKRSKWLLLAAFLGACVISAAVGVATYYAIAIGMNYGARAGEEGVAWDPVMIGWIAGAASLLAITGSSVLKLWQLGRGGGAAVAESMGGTPIDPGSHDPGERRLLNVVEEMAIASGVPVPPVYRIDSSGINAFAAGMDEEHAVLGFTSGAIDQLSRDELQGVAAHEFSHVLRGDMRLNMRLIGMLHGMMLLPMAGEVLMHMAFGSSHSHRHRSSSSRDRGGGVVAFFVLGLVLFVLGWIGIAISRIIQAAVSRQREFLADAAAVQFTRNPDGIAGALIRIAGGSGYVRGAHTQETGHMMIASSLRSRNVGLMATHPPLPERIRRIDPQWNGTLTRAPAPSAEAEVSAGAAGFAGGAPAAAPVSNAAEVQSSGARAADGRALTGHETRAVARAGNVDPEALLAGRTQLDQLDPQLRQAAHDPFDARALLICCVLDADEGHRRQQFEALAERDRPLARSVKQFWPVFISGDTARTRPLLIRLAAPALARLTAGQAADFRGHLQAMEAADGQIDLYEMAVRHAVDAQLSPPKRVDYYSLRGVAGQITLVLMAMAQLGKDDRAIEDGARAAGIALDRSQTLTMASLDAALADLARASPAIRKRTLDACLAAACRDGELHDHEYLLLELLAQAIRVPLPAH